MMRHRYLLVALCAMRLGSVGGEETLERIGEDLLQGALGEPLPYEVVRVFPDQNFRNPVEFVPEPGSSRIFIAEVNGEVFVFDPARKGGVRERVLDLREAIPGVHQLYGLAFHPRYLENRLVYLCYVFPGNREDGTEVIECRMDPETGQLDLQSRRLLITWRSGGHNGGSLQFGHDGYLYISTGDAEGPNPPDELKAGQDCSNLLSAILRIDVDRRDPGLPYRIPPDNPFSDSAKWRPEIWSYGYRNPWRMSFDRETGELWVGDVGWDMWELVYYVRRGSNFGWSVMEGRQPINVTWERGPTPISPPVVEHPHSEARSITGGYVYHGKRLPELEGAYIYGDYETGKIWALWHENGERTALREIADSELRIICFGQTHDGEVYIVDYAGGIYELRPRAGEREGEVSSVDPMIPARLSETGLVDSLSEGTLASGFVSYDINHPMWSDGLVGERWLGLPQGRIRVNGPRASFPEGALLVKTLRTPSESKPVETQILQRHQGMWRAFSYAWNEDGTDAVLVPAHGARRVISLGEGRSQPWHSVSRSECLVCHNAHTSGVLGFASWQLSGETRERLEELGWLEEMRSRRGRGGDRRRRGGGAVAAEENGPHPARTYLDVNCAPCHRLNGGGLVPMQLERHLPDDRLAALGVSPQRGTFGMVGAQVVAPGRPERSTLYYRMAKLGSGRMPHLGSQVVDERGLALVYDWIEGLDPKADRAMEPSEHVSRALLELHERGPEGMGETDDPFVADLLRRFEPRVETALAAGHVEEVSDPEALLQLPGDPARGREVLHGNKGALCLTCHRWGSLGRDFGPPLDGMGRRSKRDLLDSLLHPSREIATAYVNYTVTTKDERSYMGFIRHQDNRSVVLRDAALQEVEIPVATIATMTAGEMSVMPAGLLRAFSAEETADLLAYLASLR